MERAGVGLSSPALRVPPGHLGMASEGDAGPLVVAYVVLQHKVCFALTRKSPFSV